VNATEASLPIEVSDEPLVGWRCWFVLPHEGLLRPLYKRGLAWKPRQAMEAVCPEEIHAVPADDCRCGVWAVCHPMMLTEFHWSAIPPVGVAPIPGVVVVGQIAMWGNVIQHERGWRSSHAYPQHLYAFTDDPMMAEGLRERYGVPVAYGEEAERLRRLLPSQRRAQATSASATRSTGQGQRLLSEDLQAIAARLPAPLGSVAKDIIAINGWSLDGRPWGGARRDWSGSLKEDREKLAKKKQRLKTAVARGGYYIKSYGSKWKSTLREHIRAAAHELVLTHATQRAGTPDALAQRRLLWILIARRWRSAHEIHAEVIRAEELARRTRNSFTGQKLCPSTRHQRKTTAEIRRAELSNALQRLADVPTPSYREWCAMVRK
jgi:hypothetical protein